MNKRICDLCGLEIKSGCHRVEIIPYGVPYINGLDELQDLCTTCAEELKVWLKVWVEHVKERYVKERNIGGSGLKEKIEEL